MTVKRKKINIYPGLRLPAGHIYDVISSLMYALRHIMDGRTFHPACYDFANTTLELCGYMFPAAMQGVYPARAHKRVGGLVGLARTQTCVTLQMYVFSPPHSQMTATQFLFLPSRLSLVGPLSFSVCGFARQPATPSCIYYSLSLHSPLPTKCNLVAVGFVYYFFMPHTVYFSVHMVW
jgi:hypothetical protein